MIRQQSVTVKGSCGLGAPWAVLEYFTGRFVQRGFNLCDRRWSFLAMVKQFHLTAMHTSANLLGRRRPTHSGSHGDGKFQLERNDLSNEG